MFIRGSGSSGSVQKNENCLGLSGSGAFGVGGPSVLDGPLAGESSPAAGSGFRFGPARRFGFRGEIRDRCRWGVVAFGVRLRIGSRGRLQVQEIIGGLLRVAGGGEDGFLVVLEHREAKRRYRRRGRRGFRGSGPVRRRERRCRFRRRVLPWRNRRRPISCGPCRGQAGRGAASSAFVRGPTWRSSFPGRGSSRTAAFG
jgi:hypothetical protein